MAEVATSVLHNVGNVLNSVNVSCSVISDTVRRSRITTVTKTAEITAAAPRRFARFPDPGSDGATAPGLTRQSWRKN